MKEENTYNKTCLYCGKSYIGKGNSKFGICDDCDNDRTCNMCGQPISKQEYESNPEGYCDECYEEIEYQSSQIEDPTMLNDEE